MAARRAPAQRDTAEPVALGDVSVAAGWARLQTFFGDSALLAALTIVAVLSGLLLLWVNNPSGGSAEDRIVAFLWGLGVHEVSGTVYAGIDAARQKLEPPQPQP